MRATPGGHNTPLGYYADQGMYRAAVSMMAKGCCGLSTASEVFLIFYYPTIFISVQLECNIFIS